MSGYGVFAQDATRLDSISIYLDKGNSVPAKKLADQLKNEASFIGNPDFWQLRGDTYFFISMNGNKSVSAQSAAILVAVDAYRRSYHISESPAILQKLSDCYDALIGAAQLAFEADYFTEVIYLSDETEALSILLNEEGVALKAQADLAFKKGISYDRLARNTEALETYNALVQQEYSNPDLYARLAYLYRRTEGYDKALEILQTGVAKYPKNKSLLYDLIEMAIITGQEEELIGLLEDEIGKRQPDPELYFIMASLYDNVNQTDRAEDYYLRSIEVDSNFTTSAYNLATLYYNQAVGINKKLTSLSQTDSLYAVVLIERDELYQKALPYFERAKSYNPEVIERIINHIRTD